jgi:hypothetical protein
VPSGQSGDSLNVQWASELVQSSSCNCWRLGDFRLLWICRAALSLSRSIALVSEFEGFVLTRSSESLSTRQDFRVSQRGWDFDSFELILYSQA